MCIKTQPYLLIFLAVLMLGIGFASAASTPGGYQSHKQSTALQFSVTSNNATYCNITTVDAPFGTVVMNLRMTKNANTHYITIGANNLTTLGDYCYNVECYDSANNAESGSICRTVTPSGFLNMHNLFYVWIILVVIIFIFGFTVKDSWIIALGSILLFLMGLYVIGYGIDFIKDQKVTWGIGIVVIFTALYCFYRSVAEYID